MSYFEKLKEAAKSLKKGEVVEVDYDNSKENANGFSKLYSRAVRKELGIEASLTRSGKVVIRKVVDTEPDETPKSKPVEMELKVEVFPTVVKDEVSDETKYPWEKNDLPDE